MADQTPASFPVMADQPVRMSHPIRRARQFLVLLIAGILLMALTAGMWAYRSANESMNRRVSDLEQDLAQRRAARDQTQRQTEQLLEQYRQTICTLASRDRPDDPAIQRLLTEYRCAADPTPSPSVSGGPPHA